MTSQSQKTGARPSLALLTTVVVFSGCYKDLHPMSTDGSSRDQVGGEAQSAKSDLAGSSIDGAADGPIDAPSPSGGAVGYDGGGVGGMFDGSVGMGGSGAGGTGGGTGGGGGVSGAGGDAGTVGTGLLDAAKADAFDAPLGGAAGGVGGSATGGGASGSGGSGAPGQPCQSSATCASGLFCSPDGYCCDLACTGPCQSCETGACKAVTGAPHAGHGNCAGDTAECAGSCTGAANGQCTWVTTACGQASCTTLTNAQSEPTGTTFLPQGTCSTGACLPGTASSCASSLVCASATACKTACATDADCLVGNACTAGVCGGKKGNGTACSANNQCQLGNCVDGFCCESACTGTCVACSRAKTGMADGYCRDVTTGTDPDSECPVETSKACGLDGTCGTGGACRFQSASLTCGTVSCAGGMYTPLGRCDGAGACLAGTPALCTGHLPCVSTTACATSCTANSTTGCDLGYKCASNGVSCVLATMPCGNTANCPVANGGGQCCVSGPTGGPYAQTCLSPGSSCDGSSMACHSKADCPSGQVCCASRGGCVVGSTRCVLPTDPECQDGSKSSADQFCDLAVPECPAGTTCLAGGMGSCGPNDIYTCQ